MSTPPPLPPPFNSRAEKFTKIHTVKKDSSVCMPYARTHAHLKYDAMKNQPQMSPVAVLVPRKVHRRIVSGTPHTPLVEPASHGEQKKEEIFFYLRRVLRRRYYY